LNDPQITEPQHHGLGDDPSAELSEFDATTVEEMPFHIPRD